MAGKHSNSSSSSTTDRPECSLQAKVLPFRSPAGADETASREVRSLECSAALCVAQRRARTWKSKSRYLPAWPCEAAPKIKTRNMLCMLCYAARNAGWLAGWPWMYDSPINFNPAKQPRPALPCLAFPLPPLPHSR